MDSGWIKIDRSMLKHWIMDDPIKLHAWITMLMTVNWESRKVSFGNQLMVCGRGESLRSLSSWVSVFGKGWTIGKVRRFFKMLEDDQMIVLRNERKTTRLTICNYEYYQGARITNESQMNLKQITNESQTNTNKEVKEVKKIKKRVINNSTEFDFFIEQFNHITGKNFRGDKKSRTQLSARIKEGFTVEDVLKAVRNCSKDSYHIQHPNYLTPEFITRVDKLQKYLNYIPGPRSEKEMTTEEKWQAAIPEFIEMLNPKNKAIES